MKIEQAGRFIELDRQEIRNAIYGYVKKKLTEEFKDKHKLQMVNCDMNRVAIVAIPHDQTEER